MSILHASLFIALLVTFLFGLLVLYTNHRRPANQAFFLMSLALAAWMGFLLMGFRADTVGLAKFCIQEASAMGAFVPVTFTFLLLAIVYSDRSWGFIIRRARYWLIAFAATALVCQTPLLVRDAIMPEPGTSQTIPEPVYGPGFLILNLYFLVALVRLFYDFIRHARQAKGIRRTELQFTLLAYAACIFVGSIFTFIIPLAVGSSQYVQFAPLNVIILISVIAYGIATRRIMDVAHVLRATTAYALMTVYLVGIYFLTWLLADFFNNQFIQTEFPFQHIVAALALAFAMSPAHGRFQSFAQKLFINLAPTNVNLATQRVQQIVRSIATVDDLLKRFSEVVADSVGTDRVHILLGENGNFRQVYPQQEGMGAPSFSRSDSLARAVEHSDDPIVTDIIQRMRPSPVLMEAGNRMKELDASVAVGIKSKDDLEGIMLLGPRLSGRIYSAAEQDALKILSNQLAVAIENAKLYTQVQDSKIYNDILVDNLISGVIAADAQQRVTVFNREAQRITRMHPRDVLGKPIDVLPSTLATVLLETYQSQKGVRDQDRNLPGEEPEEDIPVRLGSTIFMGYTGDVLGALLVFNDLTTIKKLEQQVRRTDRLASLGTMSAGMAHEIKNPLVTIKTFTDLLPERYDDNDFRTTFSSLVGTEVRRIDGIVNQLLRFARPAKPDLNPIHLHEVLRSTIRLIDQQIRKKGLRLDQSLLADSDVIMGDSALLEQSFINFYLNAIDSMDNGGVLTVSTEEVYPSRYSDGMWDSASARPHIKLTIQDSGAGIPAEDIGHVFDPFFTTKSHGTGLGLSVSHGIIQEHHGIIDVESELDVGTSFILLFPLIREEARV